MTTEALARNSDPGTSHAAAATFKPLTLMARIVESLRHSDGLTTHQIAAALDASLVSVSPRMKPLVQKNVIRDSGRRDQGRIVWQLVMP